MSAPAAKPDDLPDLPILLRLGLRSLLALSVGCAALGCLCAVDSGTTFPRAPNAAPFVALPAAAMFSVVWKTATDTAKRRLELRNWWQVEMIGTSADLTLEWQPQLWDDLAPRPSAVLRAFQITACLFVLLLSLDSSFSTPGFFLSLSVFVASIAINGAYVIFVMATLAFLNSQGTCKARLKNDVRFTAPPFLYSFGLFDNFYRWSSVYMPSRKLAAVQFSDGGVAIANKTRRDQRTGFVVPTRDPDQRRAIADWAANHDIPVTGDI